MPNPLLNQPANTSDSKMTERFMDGPEPETPVVEEYKGDNNAYRGTEPHGVPFPHYEYRDPIEASDEEDAIEGYDSQVPPILVKLDAVRPQSINLASRQWPLTDRAVQIIGRKRARVTVTIVNVGGQTAYIDGEAGVTSNFNGGIPALTSLTLSNVNNEIWAVCAAGLSTTLYIFEEYATEEGKVQG